jgi:hypothetical protein
MLQVDHSRLTADVLSRISQQLEGFQQSRSDQLLSFHAETPSFRPSPSIIWVNSLWFLSLIFSLSASFFSIMIKQWLREYGKWTAPLYDTRENVLVQQIRFAAWTEWNLDAIISSIPAILELAVVQFLVGLVIFLWTVEPIVAVVATVAVVILMTTASIFTVLPTFFKRCPYKSPTAWAFMVLWQHLVKSSHVVYFFFQKICSLRCSRATDILWGSAWASASWRERELNDISHSELDQLAADSSEPFPGLEDELHNQLNTENVLRTINHMETLSRCLLRVAKTSRSSRIISNVLLGTETFYSASVSYDVRYLSTIYLLFRLNLGYNSAREPAALGLTEYPAQVPKFRLWLLLDLLRHCYCTPHSTRQQAANVHTLPTQRNDAFGFLDRTFVNKKDWFCTPLHFDFALHLLVGEVRNMAQELVILAMSHPVSISEPSSIASRLMGLLCAFHRLVRAAQYKWPEFRFATKVDASRSLLQTYNSLSHSPQSGIIDDWVPGIRTSLLSTICRLIEVRFDSQGVLIQGIFSFVNVIRQH